MKILRLIWCSCCYILMCIGICFIIEGQIARGLLDIFIGVYFLVSNLFTILDMSKEVQYNK